ncbi:MAG: hypothetical protein ABEJ40_06905 [Haloarculaceae archaeon]
MTGRTTGVGESAIEGVLGSLDADSVQRVDVHLERALDAENEDEKDFHVRQARQLLEAYKDVDS